MSLKRSADDMDDDLPDEFYGMSDEERRIEVAERTKFGPRFESYIETPEGSNFINDMIGNYLRSNDGRKLLSETLMPHSGDSSVSTDTASIPAPAPGPPTVAQIHTNMTPSKPSVSVVTRADCAAYFACVVAVMGTWKVEKSDTARGSRKATQHCINYMRADMIKWTDKAISVVTATHRTGDFPDPVYADYLKLILLRGIIKDRRLANRHQAGRWLIEHTLENAEKRGPVHEWFAKCCRTSMDTLTRVIKGEIREFSLDDDPEMD